MTRVVVIGAGVAGLVASLRLARGGAAVTLVHKGVGGLQLSQGTVDILGYSPERVLEPLAALDAFAAANPGHPYVLLKDSVREGADFLAELVGPALLVGDAAVNLQLPTAVGAVRPTALAAPSMIAGACVAGAQVLIVGFKQLKDFYPELVAENLSRTTLPAGGTLAARHHVLDFPAIAGEADSSGLTYARALDDPAKRRALVAALRPLVQQGEVVGLPAFLGLDDHGAWSEIEEELGTEVFEIPLPPPSVPGMRLNRALTALAKAAGVRVVPGGVAIGVETADGAITAVISEAAGGPRRYAADAVVLATGGFESGALALDSYGVVTETALGLPLAVPDGPLVHGDYWGAAQPLFTVGVAVDADLRVVRPGTTEPVYPNLYAAGGILAGATRWAEKSGEGIALASAVRAADAILAAAGVEQETSSIEGGAA